MRIEKLILSEAILVSSPTLLPLGLQRYRTHKRGRTFEVLGKRVAQMLLGSSGPRGDRQVQSAVRYTAFFQVRVLPDLPWFYELMLCHK